MSVKKILLSALAAGCALSLLTPAAFAHGRHSRRTAQTSTSQCAVCTVPGCDLDGRHWHGSTLYCGYAHAGGVCDGGCVSLCTVEGCELTGRHYHNGVVYCGTHHAAGYCSGACPLTQSAQYSHGCHSRHH